MKFYGGRFVAGLFLLSGLGLAISSAGAEVKDSKTRVKNHGSSCYAQLVSMLHNSSFPTSAKNLRYLTLHVETDEGDGITLRVSRVRSEKKNNKKDAVDIDSDTVGWLLYQPSSHNMVSLSSFLNPERPDVTTFLEKGDSLKFDRRYAYLFDMCRKKRNVELETSCAAQHKDALQVKILSREGDAPVKAKTSGATLYAAPDKSCVMAEKAHIASDSQVTVQSMSDEFYYIRYDEGKKGFVTGWVLKDTLPTLNIALPEKERLEIAQGPQKKTQKGQKQSKKIDRKPVRHEKTDKVGLSEYDPNAVAEPAVFDVEEVSLPPSLVKQIDDKKLDRIRLSEYDPNAVTEPAMFDVEEVSLPLSLVKQVDDKKLDRIRLSEYDPNAEAEPAVFDVEEVPLPSSLVGQVDNKKLDRIRLPKAKPSYVKAKNND